MQNGRVFESRLPNYMNEDNKISFAYICGKNHGKVEITHEQLNKVMKILYG